MAEHPRGPRFWLALLRSFSFPASMIGVLVGTAAAAGFREWRWDVLIAEICAVPLLHGLGNLLNDYFDYRSGVDRRTDADDGRPGRFLVRGTVTPRTVLRAALLCGVLTAPFAAYLIWRGGWPVIAVGLVALVGAYAYTGRPFALKYRSLGELCIFIVFGPAIVAGAAYMQTDTFDTVVILHAVPLGMLIAAILAANNLRDVDEDGEARIRTLAHRLGPTPYLWLYLTLLFAPAALLLAFAFTGLTTKWVLLALLALPLGVPPAKLALLHIRRPDADAVTARYMTIFGALIFVGLVIGGPASG